MHSIYFIHIFSLLLSLPSPRPASTPPFPTFVQLPLFKITHQFIWVLFTRSSLLGFLLYHSVLCSVTTVTHFGAQIISKLASELSSSRLLHSFGKFSNFLSMAFHYCSEICSMLISYLFAQLKLTQFSRRLCSFTQNVRNQDFGMKVLGSIV